MGELRCAVLIAVRCGAYLDSEPLDVRRFARCNDVGGPLQSAESVKLNINKGGWSYAALC
jgi:hypothetical protein